MSTSALSTETLIMTPDRSVSDMEVDLMLLIPSMSIGDLSTEAITISGSINGEELLAPGVVGSETRVGSTVQGEY